VFSAPTARSSKVRSKSDKVSTNRISVSPRSEFIAYGSLVEVHLQKLTSTRVLTIEFRNAAIRRVSAGIRNLEGVKTLQFFGPSCILELYLLTYLTRRQSALSSCKALLLARLVGLQYYCFAGWRLLSVVVVCQGLYRRRRAGRPGAWAVGRPTLHGGPVRLRPAKATPC